MTSDATIEKRTPKSTLLFYREPRIVGAVVDGKLVSLPASPRDAAVALEQREEEGAHVAAVLLNRMASAMSGDGDR